MGISLINTATLFCQLHHAAQILADNIKLQVHYTTNLKRMEVGMLIGIWDNGNWKVSSVGLQTVRLTPFTVTEPLSTVKYPRFAISGSNAYLNVKYQLPSASSIATQVAV